MGMRLSMEISGKVISLPNAMTSMGSHLASGDVRVLAGRGLRKPTDRRVHSRLLLAQ